MSRRGASSALLVPGAVIGAVVGVVLALVVALPATSHAASGPSVGLPAGVPDAALRPEPVLPAPVGWPFGEQFPRTSGTGRLAGGAAFWSDFLYDDHGATSTAAFPGNLLTSVSTLAPTQGVYTYNSPDAHGNGADIFRDAVGADADATYWRVDWNTLAKPDVPLAVWGLDLDGSTGTGTAVWPASTGVVSAGEDRFLVVSGHGAVLEDITGAVQHSYSTTVDLAARSFVVRVPKADLPVSGTSVVRLVSGVDSGDGRNLAVPSTQNSETPGAARAYNVSYRSVSQEPPVYTDGTAMTTAFATALGQFLTGDLPGVPPDSPLRPILEPLRNVGADGQTRIITGNFWMEDHQADVLAQAVPDISAFSSTIDWSALATQSSTPEPRPTGYSNRWYVTDLALGDGVVMDAQPPGDLRPNYLGRVQPYAVQVPPGVGDGAPLTWVLHSLSVNHNQYGALDPQTLQQLCDDRHSICATTLGFGPDGWYFDEAEHDFWQVWRDVAATYRPGTEQTLMSGYSMGGYAAYKLGLAHPDLFAAALALAGPPSCGVQVAEGVFSPADQDPMSHCAADGPTGPLVSNALHVPYSIAQGGADELVPFTSVVQRAQEFSSLGLRYAFAFYPTEDHLVYATQDRFQPIIDTVGGTPTRTVNPSRVQYSWYPSLDSAQLGIGATTAYWLSGLKGSTDALGTVSSVVAHSLALPDPAVTTTATGPTPLTVPVPGVLTGQTWQLGAAPAVQQVLDLTLTGVSALTVDAARAGLTCGAAVKSTSTTPVALTMTGLPTGATLDGTGTTATLPTGSGGTTVVCPTAASGGGTGAGGGTTAAATRGSASPSLARTGGAPALSLAGLGLLATAAVVRRRRALG